MMHSDFEEETGIYEAIPRTDKKQVHHPQKVTAFANKKIPIS
jgi:hypothetical protein